MPAKTPMYLKTTTPKRGKKLKLRDVLSGDMISPPLGDVRHSAHVGPEGEGDMFGDVGFLQGKMDMLPSQGKAQNGPGRAHSVERRLDDGFVSGQDSHNYSYNGYHYINSSTGLLKTTVSMPAFLAQEQAPPKPPRLHLEDPAPGNGPPHAERPEDSGDKQSHGDSYGHTPNRYKPRQSTLSPCDRGGDVSFSPSIHGLMPSSGSFSEVSSEDSASETCGPLDPRRGLSLDSDAGLSNEDLRSDRSESPVGAATHLEGVPVRHPTSHHSAMCRSDSMAGLNLDLGPSILEDVLGIMERYKKVDDRCEL